MSIANPRNPVPPRVWDKIKAQLARYGVEIAEDEDVPVIDKVGDEAPAFAVLYHKLDVPQPVVLNKEPLRLPGDE